MLAPDMHQEKTSYCPIVIIFGYDNHKERRFPAWDAVGPRGTLWDAAGRCGPNDPHGHVPLVCGPENYEQGFAAGRKTRGAVIV